MGWAVRTTNLCFIQIDFYSDLYANQSKLLTLP